ncbi:hypothetical protein Tco_0536340 [Tanacetum coccineum]
MYTEPIKTYTIMVQQTLLGPGNALLKDDRMVMIEGVCFKASDACFLLLLGSTSEEGCYLIIEKSSNSSVAAMETLEEEVQNQPNELTPKRIKIDEEEEEDRISPMLDCLILEIISVYLQQRSHYDWYSSIRGNIFGPSCFKSHFPI